MKRTLLILAAIIISLGTIAGPKEASIAKRIIDSSSRHFAPDKRTAIFSIQVAENSENIVIRGKTNLPDAKRAVLDSLSTAGITFTDSIVVLPEKHLGNKVWGIINISVANMRTVPAHAGEMASQVLMGTPVKVLESKDERLRVQTPDQYIGWVDGGAIILKTEAEMETWRKSQKYVFAKLYGHAFSAPSKKAEHISDLILSNIFEVVSQTKGFLQISLPDGRIAFVPKNECISFDEWANKPFDVKAAASVARQMLGVPYLWGGTSSKTVDCSGLMKTSFFSQGIILARDASQQVRYGTHPDPSDYHNLLLGDLVFFGSSPQRITHVGMYLGNGQYIHATSSSSMVRTNSFDPDNNLFNLNLKKSLMSASRITGSLDTEGIVRVKNHPWYSDSDNK